MGDQGQQVQQIQQPVVVYPNTYTKQNPDPSPSSSGSGGSFTTVFIVVAVILVLSAIACVFGRLCNGERLAAKRKHRSRHPKHEKGSAKMSREIRPVEREPRERVDMEFGFDMRQPEPVEKPRDHGDDIEFGFDNNRGERDGERGGTPPPSIKHGVRFTLPENENQHAKGEIRHGGPEFEYRPEH